MALFYLIRHGQPDYSPCDERGFIGHGRDLARLSIEGIRQAEITAQDERLMEADIIVSSPYTRAIETALRRLGALDERHETGNGHPKLGQIVYHIKESNPYLIIDFNWQLHSRDRMEYHYIMNDNVEGAMVVFDKDNIVRFEEAREQEISSNKLKCKEECDYRYSQHLRVSKYIKRGMYPESYAYYNKNVIEPLVMLLRLKYTPLYPYHFMLHISKHMPTTVVNKLEKLIQVATLGEMEIAMQNAEEWYQELHDELFN